MIYGSNDAAHLDLHGIILCMKYAILAALVLVGFVLYTNINKDKVVSNDTPVVKTVEEKDQNIEEGNSDPVTENPLLTAFYSDVDLNAPVVTTQSGLKYAVIKDGGEGDSPTVNSTVTVHYHGTTLDGEVFDSSVLRDETIEFPLRNLVVGWQEGIPLMQVGDKYRLTVPAVLAYGESGRHSLSGKDLVFDIELFAFEN